jgi:hypothetical protein
MPGPREEARMAEAEPASAGALAPVGAHPLVLQQAVPPDRQPGAVYLARLAVRSRRTMRYALDRLAGILSGGRLTAQDLDWSQLRFPHTAAVGPTCGTPWPRPRPICCFPP